MIRSGPEWLIGTNTGQVILLATVPTGEQIDRLQPFENAATRDVCFLSAGRRIAASFSGHDPDPAVLIVWDAESLVETTRLDNVVRVLAVSPDEHRLALVRRDKTISIWDVDARRTDVNFAGHSDVVISGDFSPDGRYFLSTSLSGPIRLWSIESGQLILEMKLGLFAPRVVFTSNLTAVATHLRVSQRAGKSHFEYDLVPIGVPLAPLEASSPQRD